MSLSKLLSILTSKGSKVVPVSFAIIAFCSVGLAGSTEGDLDASTSANFSKDGSVTTIYDEKTKTVSAYYMDDVPAQVADPSFAKLSKDEQKTILEQVKEDVQKKGTLIYSGKAKRRGKTEGDQDSSTPACFYGGWGWGGGWNNYGWGGGYYYPSYYGWGGYNYPYYGGYGGWGGGWGGVGFYGGRGYWGGGRWGGGWRGGWGGGFRGGFAGGGFRGGGFRGGFRGGRR